MESCDHEASQPTDERMISEVSTYPKLNDDDKPAVSEDLPLLPTMSKRQRKRLESKLKKKLFLKEKRVEERQKKKKRLKEARAKGLDMGPSRKALKLNKMAHSSCKVSVAVDCSFDDLMTEKDIKSIVKQVNFCYASNRRVTDPVQFYITSFNKKLKSMMDNIGQHPHWDVNLHEKSYEEIFEKDNIVYLSSDSKNTLESLEDTKVYIIGGLVDHNHHKGLCLKLAEEKGFAHARLPIGDYVTLESRNVLTVNHVFDILLMYTQTKNWKEAFHKVIPQRKILVPTESSEEKHKISELQVVDNDTNSEKHECDQEESEFAGENNIDLANKIHPAQDTLPAQTLDEVP